MKKVLAVFCLALIASCASFVNTSPHASADALCTNLFVPTPPPAGGRAMLGTCVNGILQVTTVGGSPIVFHTGALPVALPTSFQTAFPTPRAYATNASGQLIVAPTAMPTLGVVCISGCPTPLAVQPVSGTITVNTPPPFSGSVTEGTSPWIVNTPVPFPTAIGGTLKVDGSAVTQPVSGTFFQATQPVSGTFFQATQPVSGTVTANAGTGFPTPQPLATTVGNLLNVSVTGTNLVTQGTSPWVVTTPAPFSGVVSGTVTANAGTGFATPIPYPTTAGTLVLKVDGSAVTQPVSGTLTVNTPPPTTTVTVTQGTGTNLHAVLDSGTTTVTQGTGTNLHAVLDANAGVIIGNTRTDQTTPGATDLVHSKDCDKSTPTQCASVSAGGLISTGPFLNATGVPAQAVACDKSAVVNISTITTTSLVAVSGATAVYICAYDLEVTASSAGTWKLEYGTGAACVTTQTALTGTYTDSVGAHDASGSGIGAIMQTPASQAVCMVTAGTSINIQGRITYAQF